MSSITYLASPELSRGRPAPQAAREAFRRLAEGLVERGRFTLQQVQQDALRDSREVRLLLEAGYLQQKEDRSISLTPLALRAAEEQVLAELFTLPKGDLPGRHQAETPAAGPEAGDEVRARLVGEPFDHVELSATLRQALSRGWPLQMREEDVQIRPGPASSRCVIVLLLDLSGSMARQGKFSAARRAALGLRALVRRRYPEDELFCVGFASRAVLLSGEALLTAMPREVGMFDARQGSVRVRQDHPEIPEHFTNLQAGLRLARRLMRTRANVSKQILVITDGEPTGHLEGEEMVLAYPPSEATYRHTLLEAGRCVREGMALGIFGLIDPQERNGFKDFLDKLAQTGRGSVHYCSPRHLGTSLVDRYLCTRSK